jgi:glycosyltransferase involved in cell wall biosynthesis
MRGNLEATVQTHQLKDVRFAGFRNQGELPAFYALADIFVLPSINETWGLVINEAMNAGCAIITTDQVGSAADLVRSGHNGFTIKACDISALTNALAACLAEERFRGMGERSLEIIQGWGIKENVEGLRGALGFLASSKFK